MPETLEMYYDSTRARRRAVDRSALAWLDTRKPSSGDLLAAEGPRWRDATRRRRTSPSGSLSWWILLVCLLLCWISPASAALLEFSNCLSKDSLDSNPLTLQYVPLDVGVWFNQTNPLQPLNVTIYGNVSGTTDGAEAPPIDSPKWSNDNETVGKIVDLDTENNILTTLIVDFDVLTYVPWNHDFAFCDMITQGHCPLAPVFHGNASDVKTLNAFSVNHNMLSTYRFSTITPTFTIIAGDSAKTILGCVEIPITPDFGTSLKNALAYVPVIILALMGIATMAAGMFTPWGTLDVFRWTSNYGRDEDVLRLITPGFADCLQYLQFVVLTGSLSLNYPGFFQPAVSHAAWSTLMFNQSFLHPNSSYTPIKDGVYAINGSYGMDRMNQLVGMATTQDIWPGLMVWVLAILGVVIVAIQLWFLLRWVSRELAHTAEEDLQAKNIPFTVGNVIRIVLNYLLLPIVSLSFFQLVIAKGSPAYNVALAALVIVILICFFVWFVRVIISTRPTSHLFDDLPTVMLYGPLYNTYCDDAAAFAMVPIFLNILRGVGIGALQPSGIAQVVLLAICEVISVLTLIAFRPFPGPTHMNLYHCIFSTIRFLTIILMIVFVPSLGVSSGTRGWIGYTILVLHAIVLIFGFFLNSLQTLIEVLARLAGAGGAARGGLTKVFGKRQLSRRNPRMTRQSLGSEAAMLAPDSRMSGQFDGSRARSMSGNSTLLLNRATASDGRGSALDYASSQGGHSRAASANLYTNSPTAYQGAGASPSSSTFMSAPPRDPYYRPPRPTRQSTQSDTPDRRKPTSRSFLRRNRIAQIEADAGAPSGRNTPVPAYLPAPKDDLELDDSQQSKDYAVREADFYYRVRGPPLSQSRIGTRKLKTGPADPTGPVSSATGWFRDLFQGKTKDKGKGFEVVRSARAPPPGLFPESGYNEPYQDDPQSGGHSRHVSRGEEPYRDSEGDGDSDGQHSGGNEAPMLPPLASVGGLGLQQKQENSDHGDDTPRGLPTVTETAASTPSPRAENPNPEVLQPDTPTGARLPFSSDSSPSRNREQSIASTNGSMTSSHRHPHEGGRPDRPSSMGYVAQHRMSDNIHEINPGDEPSFAGSAAELVLDESVHTNP